MIAAAQVLGATLPSRKVLATARLDVVFAKVHLLSSQKLSALLHIDASPDGWRKKYREQGVSLANFCHMTPNRALLHDVINRTSLRKDS